MTDHIDDVLARAAALTREVLPDRDLWPGIEAGIARRRRPTVPARWGTRLAAGIALVAVSSLTTWTLMRGEPGSAPAAVLAEAAFGAEHLMGPGFLQARDELATRVDATLARLSPQTRSVIASNLAEIRRSITAINDALRAEPSNASLQQLLYSTYQQELDVLREVSNLDRLNAEGVSI